MWQDYVIAVGAIGLALALIPSIRADQKPSVFTSAPTAFVLFVFSASYASLDLWFAACTQFVGAALWTVLALQAFRTRP